MVSELNADNFEQEVIKAEIPVIIDFWADWCGPCRMLAPILDELSPEYGGKLKFFKLSVERYPKLADKFGIQGIPCLIVFNKGEEADRIVGFAPKEQLKQKIDSILAKLA